MNNNYNLSKLNSGLNELNISATDDQVGRLVRFYDMVVETNKVMNLTAITEFDEFVDKHFLDSLLLESVYPNINQDVKVIDVGTGAGFPRRLPRASRGDLSHGGSGPRSAEH